MFNQYDRFALDLYSSFNNLNIMENIEAASCFSLVPKQTFGNII